MDKDTTTAPHEPHAGGGQVERQLGLAPERDIVGRLRHVVPEHGWAVVNTKTDGIVIWFSERMEFHTERKARAWLQENAETHRTHEARPYKDRCIEHEAADEIERLRARNDHLIQAIAGISVHIVNLGVPAFGHVTEGIDKLVELVRAAERERSAEACRDVARGMEQQQEGGYSVAEFCALRIEGKA